MHRQLSRFAMIGVAATLLYAVLAFVLSDRGVAGLPASSASLAAYALASVFSYAGHKYFTFVSGETHRFEAPRFAIVTLVGLSIAFGLPELLSGVMGLPAQIPIVATCVFIPVVNYLVLRHWVFAGPRAILGDPVP